MDRKRFESLVARAIEELPEEFLTRLDNVEVVVEDYSVHHQRDMEGFDQRETLLGLYQGVPLTERGAHYGMVLPDMIIIFQKPIEHMCREDAKIIAEIRRIVRHEIAHHFGISDKRLQQLEKD